MNFSPGSLKLKECLTNIHRFSREMMNFYPSKQQEQLFEKVQFETFAPLEMTKKGIFCASGQGPGKTSATAVVATFRLLRVLNSMVVVTSPTAVQVQDVWMGEYRRRIAASRPEIQALLDVQKTKVEVKGFPGWCIKTRTASREANAQGYHEKNLTVIADEASGIPREMWRVFKGTLTGENNLLIGVGNPNDRNTEFFDAFNKDARLYHLMNWSAEDSPHVDPKHIRRMEEEYGRDSDIFRVRVLGQFPLEAANVVIRYEDLTHACRETSFTDLFLTQTPEERKNVRQFGIDLARFGSDESVIVARYNSAMVGMKHFSKKEPVEVLEQAMLWQKELDWRDQDTTYCVDAGGMGQSAMLSLYRSKKRVYEFNSGATAHESRLYANAITEAYFQLKKLTRNRRIHLKEDLQLFAQLVNREYHYDKENKFILESKDQYLERVGTEEYSSPDRADAAALAFYPHATSGLVSLPIR